jgi:GNAT superfamily N-acetyltransferase
MNRTTTAASAMELVLRGAQIELRDGSRVRIRQGHHTDCDLLVRGFERLGRESRYRRFLTPMRDLGEKTVRYMTELDHHDHEAMIALDEQGQEGIGDAFYVRDAERPDTAEVAVTVVDAWQGRGLGTLLLESICARARDEGIRTFTALMLARNGAMMHLFERLGLVRIVDRAAGTVEIEVAITGVGVAPDLKEPLRIAARHDVAAQTAGCLLSRTGA